MKVITAADAIIYINSACRHGCSMLNCCVELWQCFHVKPMVHTVDKLTSIQYTVTDSDNVATVCSY